MSLIDVALVGGGGLSEDGFAWPWIKASSLSWPKDAISVASWT